ncbi:MAG: hypothetical protein GF393_04790 [Armatimonadia bacterium]|nr:hypothetical protein [Armatimonadia bacterium]
MGTSTYHRSPETEAWKRVRELYAQPDPSPSQVVSRIVAALEPQTRAGMSDAAVTTCLGTVVEGVQKVAASSLEQTLDELGAGREPAALQMASGLRSLAEKQIAAGGFASRFGDLALDAVGTTSLAVATLSTAGAGVMELPLSVAEANFARFDREDHLHELASLFVGHDLDRTFRYFVARDVGDFIGGEGIPSVSHANRLEDAVAAHCREAWSDLALDDFEDRLSAVGEFSTVERVDLLGPVMTGGVEQALELLGAGGT